MDIFRSELYYSVTEIYVRSGKEDIRSFSLQAETSF
jgi:hypothetical protein